MVLDVAWGCGACVAGVVVGAAGAAERVIGETAAGRCIWGAAGRGGMAGAACSGRVAAGASVADCVVVSNVVVTAARRARPILIRRRNAPLGRISRYNTASVIIIHTVSDI